jgi:hypothetical protein
MKEREKNLNEMEKMWNDFRNKRMERNMERQLNNLKIINFKKEREKNKQVMLKKIEEKKLSISTGKIQRTKSGNFFLNTSLPSVFYL